jgi:hypothetical protein
MNLSNAYAGARLANMLTAEAARAQVRLANATPEELAVEVAKVRRMWRVMGVLYLVPIFTAPLGVLMWKRADRWAVRSVVKRHRRAQQRLAPKVGTAADADKVRAALAAGDD